MSDLISREAILKHIEKIRQSALTERKKGRWISADEIFHGVPFYCSECGEVTRDTVMRKPRWNFCPNCGADMRGEGAEEEVDDDNSK